jgi:WD40 repeat protein
VISCVLAAALFAPSVDAPPANESVRKLIEKLGSDDFDEREAAAKKLTELGSVAVDQLREAVKSAEDTEVKARASLIVKAIAADGFGQERIFKGHAGEGVQIWVSRVAVSPDGKQILTAAGDNLRLWDVATGKEVQIFAGPPQFHWAIGFSADGKTAFGAGNDAIVRTWDVSTGKEVRSLKGHTESVWGAALSPDGKLLATGSWDKSVRLWEAATGKPVRKFDGVEQKIRCLAFAPDGKRIAAGLFDGDGDPSAVWLWDVGTGKKVLALEGHTKPITSVCYSSDGARLLTASFDGSVRLWDASNGKELKKFEGHTARVECAAFVGENKVVSCSDIPDGTVRVWDVASGKELHRSEPASAGYMSVTGLPDGVHAVSTGKDGVVRLWRWKK